MKLVAGNSNRPLAEAIAAYLNTSLAKCIVRRGNADFVTARPQQLDGVDRDFRFEVAVPRVDEQRHDRSGPRTASPILSPPRIEVRFARAGEGTARVDLVAMPQEGSHRREVGEPRCAASKAGGPGDRLGHRRDKAHRGGRPGRFPFRLPTRSRGGWPRPARPAKLATCFRTARARSPSSTPMASRFASTPSSSPPSTCRNRRTRKSSAMSSRW